MDDQKKNPADNLKPFVKGDPRINRNGRPRKFEQLRKMAVSIAHEPAKDSNGKDIIIDGHIATNAEMIMRTMMKDKKYMREFLEIAYGKVPDQVDVTTKGESLNDKLSTEERVNAALAIFAAASTNEDSNAS